MFAIAIVVVLATSSCAELLKNPFRAVGKEDTCKVKCPRDYTCYRLQKLVDDYKFFNDIYLDNVLDYCARNKIQIKQFPNAIYLRQKQRDQQQHHAHHV